MEDNIAQLEKIRDAAITAAKYMIRVGNICKDEKGILGVVTELPKCSHCGCSNLYKGVSFTGKLWVSRKPALVSLNMEAYLEIEKDISYRHGVEHGLEVANPIAFKKAY